MRGVQERVDARAGVRWHITMMRPGKRRALDKENSPVDALIDQVEKIKAGIRAKVDAPVSGDKAAVWLHQGALPGIEEEHVAAQDAVCVVCRWCAINCWRSRDECA